MFLLCSFSHRYLKVSLSQGLTGEDGSHKGSLSQSTFIHWACCSSVPHCSPWQIGNVDDISRQTGEVLRLLTSGVGNSSRVQQLSVWKLATWVFWSLPNRIVRYQNTSCFQWISVQSVLLVRSVWKNQCIHRIQKCVVRLYSVQNGSARHGTTLPMLKFGNHTISVRY